MGQLVIPVGIPGSGKSTWVRRVYKHAEVVSSDAIRLEIFGSLTAAHDEETKQENNERVFATYHARIERLLRDGNDVVADATNLNHYARAELRDIAERTGASTHLVFFQNFVQAHRQNAARQDTNPDAYVPLEVMNGAMTIKYHDTMVRLPQESYGLVTKIRAVQTR